MKTYPIIAFLATLVVFLFGPISFELAGSLLFASGLACVILADYSSATPKLVRERRISHRRRVEKAGALPAFELAV
jgi:hypothetical protein